VSPESEVAETETVAEEVNLIMEREPQSDRGRVSSYVETLLRNNKVVEFLEQLTESNP
jgi:hypothetical protein